MAQKNCGCGQDPCITFGAEMPIYDINWDTDGEIIPEDGEGNQLPSTVMVPSDLEEDEIADYLSDKYGWLVLGFVIPELKPNNGQKPIYVPMDSEQDERVVCFICNLTPEETDGENGPMMSTLGGDACKTCAEEHGYRHPRDMIYLDAETFEATTGYGYDDPLERMTDEEAWLELHERYEDDEEWGQMTLEEFKKAFIEQTEKDDEIQRKYEQRLKDEGRDMDGNPIKGAETFEAPKTMTKTQAKKKFLAILKPYWLKALKNQRGPKLTHKQHLATLDDPDDDYYGMYEEDWDWWNNHVKTVQSGAYGPASPSGDTMLRERLPHTYYDFINSIAGAVPDELEEKYSYENGYDTSNIFYELCILDGEPDEDNFSAADKRKLAALEKRYDKDLITSDVFFDTQEAIFSDYDLQVVHRNAASAAKCRHCGPYIKAMNNTNNWNWKFLEYDDFWNGCKNEKIPVRELKSLTNIILGKAKPQPKPKAKPKAKAKAKTGRKAPTISATKRKIGTRMRGNDGKMWEVKKSGKSQRWMAGAETNESKAEYNDVKSVRLEKMNTDSYFTDDQPEYPTGNWVVEGENIYLITTYRPHSVGSNGYMDKLEPKRVVINARGEGLTEELAYEDYSNKAREMLFTRKESMETFEAPKSKANKGFVWEHYDYGDDPRTKAAQESYGKYAGNFTIGPAVKKAQKDGWKRVSFNSKYGPRIWSRMAKSPQWKPWVKDLTARCKYERHIMSETTDILNGTAPWKKPGDYSLDHMGEDGDWEILTKDNKILLLYYYADDELSTRLMRKTFTVPKTKAKPKAKTGRKAPTISATKRKIGTRMRGNDGKMWEVKKSGKSQRWMAGAEGMDSEQDGYTFAYSQGHNDGRKNIGYNQQLSSGPEQKHFRKILSQRAESFDPADAWDNHIHQEELALEAYEEYLEEVSEQDEPLSFEDWYEQTMAIYDTPEYDEYLEKQYLQMQEGAEELERQLKTLEAEGFTDTLKKVAPAIAAIVGFLGGLRAAGFKPKRR